MAVIGDVKGKIAIIFDDMADTAGTLVEASMALKKNGAKSVYAACTHPVLSGSAVKKIEKSPIKSLIVTDTIPLNKEIKKSKKIKVLTMSLIIGDAIDFSHRGKSVNKLFV